MNLAQLIDPERVQRGLHKEQQAVRPAPCPPLGTVLHDADTRVGETTRRRCSCASNAMTSSRNFRRYAAGRIARRRARQCARRSAPHQRRPSCCAIARRKRRSGSRRRSRRRCRRGGSRSRGGFCRYWPMRRGTLRVREIKKGLGEHAPRNPNTVAAALCALYEQRMVERDGTYEFFLYSITDAGRKKLTDNDARGPVQRPSGRVFPARHGGRAHREARDARRARGVLAAHPGAVAADDRRLRAALHRPRDLGACPRSPSGALRSRRCRGSGARRSSGTCAASTPRASCAR
jgi:hypothetical protein